MTYLFGSAPAVVTAASPKRIGARRRPASLQLITIPDRVWLRLDQSLVRLRQAGQLPPRALLSFWQAGERRGEPAITHHKGEQWRARQIGLIRPGDDVACERAVARGRPPDLFAIRIGRFVAAQFHLRRHPPVEFDFYELVNAPERWRVARGRNVGPDSEKVDRRSGRDQFGDLKFVEVAAGENLRPPHSRLVQNRSHALREFNQIAAVQPPAPQLR